MKKINKLLSKAKSFCVCIFFVVERVIPAFVFSLRPHSTSKLEKFNSLYSCSNIFFTKIYKFENNLHHKNSVCAIEINKLID